MEQDRLNILIILVCSLLLLAGLTKWLIVPSVTGYTVYQEAKKTNVSIQTYGENIRDLEDTLIAVKTNQSTCDNFNTKLVNEIDEYSRDLSSCEGKVAKIQATLDGTSATLQNEVDDLTQDLKKANDEYDSLKNQSRNKIDELEDEYELLAKNEANKKCCKQKVDNNDIDSFDIKSHKVVCSESGEFSISC